MKSQFIEHEDQKQQLEMIRQQLRTVKDQCDAFRLTMKRYQTNLLEYSHRILKVRREKHPHLLLIALLGNHSIRMPPSSTGTEIDADRNSNLDESSTVATSFSIAIGHSHQRFNYEDSNEPDAPRSHSMVVDSQFQRIVTIRQGEDRTDQRDSAGDSSRNQKCRRSRAKRSNNIGENR